MFDHWTLDNGLTVVGERLPYLRSVSVGVWMRVGSAMEKPEENGLSHFMEHMVFKGTEKRSTRDIAEALDAVGGQLNAFTGKECTCYYAKVIDEDLPLAMDVLSDMTLHATLDAGELDKERGVILEEISMEEDSPEDVAMELLCQAEFEGQAAAMPILGPAEQIKRYSREDLAAYRAKHYQPGNCVVALAGNYDPAEVLRLVQQYFGAWRQTSPTTPLPEFTPCTGKRAAKNKDTEQLNLCIGYPGVALRSDERYPMSVLNNLLGGSVSSRLFQKIREELGMAYSIYTNPSTFVSCGTFDIYAGVSPKNAQQVFEVIQSEVARLLTDGITEKEFLAARSQLKGAYLLGLESPSGRMQSLGRSQLLLGEIQDPADTVKKIEGVTLDSVMTIAKKMLSQEPCVTVVGRGAEKFFK